VSVAWAALAVPAVSVASVAWAALAVPAVLVASAVWAALAVPAALEVLVVWAVPVAPANLSGNTIRPIEGVRLMAIAVPQTNSAARRVVIH
jgi:hypothetical protein